MRTRAVGLEVHRRVMFITDQPDRGIPMVEPDVILKVITKGITQGGIISSLGCRVIAPVVG